MRTITVAENAGFCFGVKRATDRLEQALREARSGERIYTLGHLIHNETYNESLRRRGVKTASEAELEEISAALYGEAATDYKKAAELTERQEAVEERLLEIYEEIGV